MLILDLVDEAIRLAASKEAPFRGHLGGSMIGRKCDRELFYQFRWSKRPQHQARILRLFDRGHKEEFRFVAYLRNAGITVMAYSERLVYHDGSDSYVLFDWDAPFPPECDDVSDSEFHIERAGKLGVRLRQWRVSAVNGHFGGSLDGISISPFPIQAKIGGVVIPEGERFLNEFKTHNTKSFCALIGEGVQKKKPEHYAQMQIYMHLYGLRLALYTAVNKNDDDLYFEVIEYDEAFAADLLTRAERIIHSTILPDRIGKHASWHECKFCDYAKSCHYAAPVERNCRSCRHSRPIDDGKWCCTVWGNATIPSVDAIMKGCDNYAEIHD